MIRFLILLVAGVFMSSHVYGVEVDKATGLPSDTANKFDVSFQAIIDSVKIINNDAEKTRMFSGKYIEEKSRLVWRLQEILGAPSSSNLNRGMSAFYLGEFKANQSVSVLAQNITLQLKMQDYSDVGSIQGLPLVVGFAAQDALIKIGIPCIPAVIRNLAESDDAKVRELSLQVLYRIEGDKDILQLRLQKALVAEKDSAKQARLQTALKSLAEIKM